MRLKCQLPLGIFASFDFTFVCMFLTNIFVFVGFGEDNGMQFLVIFV